MNPEATLTFQQRLSQNPETIAASKVKFTVNKTYRLFGADIDANRGKKEELEEQLEAELRSTSLKPATVVDLKNQIKFYNDTIEQLIATRNELFPNGIEE